LCKTHLVNRFASSPLLPLAQSVLVTSVCAAAIPSRIFCCLKIERQKSVCGSAEVASQRVRGMLVTILPSLLSRRIRQFVKNGPDHLIPREQTRPRVCVDELIVWKSSSNRRGTPALFSSPSSQLILLLIYLYRDEKISILIYSQQENRT
jgi:hypothetical protein